MKTFTGFSKKAVAFALVLAMFAVQLTFVNNNVYAEESTAYNIKVNLGTNCVTIYKDGKAVKAMICSPSNETPVGTFYTPVKYRWHLMIGNCYAQYCTRITGQVLFHSVWYYRQFDNSSMSVAAYNVMGNKASHGCVRLLCKDAKWIYDNCALNTRVDIFWGDKNDDPLPRPSFTPITDGSFTNWDPTDPDPNNPWNLAKPTIKQLTKTIEYNSKTKISDVVEIKDSAGNILTNENGKVKIEGRINTKKLGRYKIKISAKDSLGNSRTATLIYKVTDTKQPSIIGYRDMSNIAMGDTLDVKSKVKAYTATGKDISSKLKITAKKNGSKKKVKVKKGKITFAKAGIYTVKYYVKGKNGRSLTRRATYKVVDKHVNAQLKAQTVYVEYGSTFNPYSYVQGITSYKGKTLKIKSKNVTVTGSVDTTVPGTYKLEYTISEGKAKFTEVVRTLTVIVKDKPEDDADQDNGDQNQSGDGEVSNED